MGIQIQSSQTIRLDRIFSFLDFPKREQNHKRFSAFLKILEEEMKKRREKK
jgi:hypothetical protein